MDPSEDVLQALKFSLKFRMFDNLFLLCQEYFCRYPVPKVLYYYARAYIDSGSPTQAIVLMKTYESIVYKDPKLGILYAQVLFECGKYTESEIVLQRFGFFKESTEFHVAASYLSGLIKIRTHRFIQSKTEFKHCVELNRFMIFPLSVCLRDIETVHDAPVSKDREHMHSKLVQSCEPITASYLETRSVPKDLESSITVMKEQASQLFRSAKYDEASQIFERLYSLHPYTMESVDLYSSLLWQLKDEKRLTELTRRSIEIGPSRSETWICVGNLESCKHQSERAIEMFNRAMRIDKSCSYAWTIAGHEFLMMDAHQEALTHFRKAIDLNPLEWSAWYGIASCFFREERFTAALFYIKKAIRINPSNSVLYYVQALIEEKMDHMDRVLELLTEAIRIEPTNLLANCKKAEILKSMNRLEEAQNVLEAVQGLIPHEPRIASLRGEIEQQLGHIKEAVYWFTGAITYGADLDDNMKALFNELFESVSVS